MTETGIPESGIPAAVVYYDRDPVSALASKVRWCKRFALLETVFYMALIPLMIKHFVLHQDSTTLDLARKVTSYFHGIVVSAFAYMAWDIRRILKWSWPFFGFALLPVGSLFAHHRLRRYESSAPSPPPSPASPTAMPIPEAASRAKS